MQKYLIRNITVVNEGVSLVKDVLIADGRIAKIDPAINTDSNAKEINGEGKHLLPGVIDDQVHFREPGLTHKATIYSESRAGIAGGVTSFMEMPNTKPPAVTQALLQDKYDIGSRNAWGNYSFFMGATNDNLVEVLKTDPQTVCGIKVFMGSSTGNMLVDREATLEELFSKCPMLIATHSEDETTIRANMEEAQKRYGKLIPPSAHP